MQLELLNRRIWLFRGGKAYVFFRGATGWTEDAGAIMANDTEHWWMQTQSILSLYINTDIAKAARIATEVPAWNASLLDTFATGAPAEASTTSEEVTGDIVEVSSFCRRKG